MQNKKSILKLFGCLLIATFLTGCSGNTFTNEDLGTGIGASVGGLLGSALTGDDVIMTLVGTGAGAYVGNKIGKEMDKNNEENK